MFTSQRTLSWQRRLGPILAVLFFVQSTVIPGALAQDKKKGTTPLSELEEKAKQQQLESQRVRRARDNETRRTIETLFTEIPKDFQNLETILQSGAIWAGSALITTVYVIGTVRLMQDRKLNERIELGIKRLKRFKESLLTKQHILAGKDDWEKAQKHTAEILAKAKKTNSQTVLKQIKDLEKSIPSSTTNLSANLVDDVADGATLEDLTEALRKQHDAGRTYLKNLSNHVAEMEEATGREFRPLSRLIKKGKRGFSATKDFDDVKHLAKLSNEVDAYWTQVDGEIKRLQKQRGIFVPDEAYKKKWIGKRALYASGRAIKKLGKFKLHYYVGGAILGFGVYTLVKFLEPYSTTVKELEDQDEAAAQDLLKDETQGLTTQAAILLINGLWQKKQAEDESFEKYKLPYDIEEDADHLQVSGLLAEATAVVEGKILDPKTYLLSEAFATALWAGIFTVHEKNSTQFKTMKSKKKQQILADFIAQTPQAYPEFLKELQAYRAEKKKKEKIDEELEENKNKLDEIKADIKKYEAEKAEAETRTNQFLQIDERVEKQIKETHKALLDKVKAQQALNTAQQAQVKASNQAKAATAARVNALKSDPKAEKPATKQLITREKEAIEAYQTALSRAQKAQADFIKARNRHKQYELPLKLYHEQLKKELKVESEEKTDAEDDSKKDNAKDGSSDDEAN